MRKGRILQIAYDPALAESRRRLLESAGFEVITASTNVEAQSVCERQQKCDAVVIGHASPWPNRNAMLHWLREHCPGVPVIALYSDKFLPLRGADHSLHANNEESHLPEVLQRLSGI